MPMDRADYAPSCREGLRVDGGRERALSPQSVRFPNGQGIPPTKTGLGPQADRITPPAGQVKNGKPLKPKRFGRCESES
jgi:hypothetical protein